jgi:hypothetical protein
MLVSNCCGASNRGNGDSDYAEYGICPECKEHCEFVDDDDSGDELKVSFVKIELSPKEIIQSTPEYKKMNPYLATMVAEGVMEGETATDEDRVAAWQYLHDTGLAYSLQGTFGRTATSLINHKIIHQ